MPSVPIFCRFEVGGSQVQNCFKLGKELAQQVHVQVKFCSDLGRSEDYFPEWKPALMYVCTIFLSPSLRASCNVKHDISLRLYIFIIVCCCQEYSNLNHRQFPATFLKSPWNSMVWVHKMNLPFPNNSV